MSEILAGPDETSPPGGSTAAGAAGAGPRAKQWLIYTGIAIALIVLGAILAEVVPVGGGGGGGGNETVPDAAAAPVATTAVTDTTPTTAPPHTTPVETTPPVVAAPPIEPIGDPIAASELGLGADAIGAFALGSDGTEAVGRLVASFGQPTVDSGVVVASAELGVCDGQMRTVRWGALTLVNKVGDAGEETLVAYRVDADQASGDADPTASLRTLSGLGLGDTVADLKVIYDGFGVELTEREGGPAFELYSSAGDLLLWGPITTADDSGTVLGVRSPATCST